MRFHGFAYIFTFSYLYLRREFKLDIGFRLILLILTSTILDPFDNSHSFTQKVGELATHGVLKALLIRRHFIGRLLVPSYSFRSLMGLVVIQLRCVNLSLYFILYKQFISIW